jgi:hypothetical protein
MDFRFAELFPGGVIFACSSRAISSCHLHISPQKQEMGEL